MIKKFNFNLEEEDTNKENLQTAVINTAVSYFLAEGYTIKALKEDNLLYIDDAIISLNTILLYSSLKYEYYLKVFLNQPVKINLDWDLFMTQRLGEAYPRAIKNLVPYVYMPEI